MGLFCELASTDSKAMFSASRVMKIWIYVMLGFAVHQPVSAFLVVSGFGPCGADVHRRCIPGVAKGITQI